MQKDDRKYAFVFTHSSRSQISVRRFEFSKWLIHSLAIIAVTAVAATGYGVHNAYQSRLAAAEIAKENDALKLENEHSKQELAKLAERLQSIEQSTQSGTPKAFIQVPPVASNVGGEGSIVFENDIKTEIANFGERLNNLSEKFADQSFVPSIFPHIGKINNEFGWRRNPFGGRSYEKHGGIDIDGERGNAVVAPADGVVTETGWRGGYGNCIEINHGNGITTRYGHLSKIDVEIGQRVSRGDQIGSVGSTGRSTGPHLHYEVRENGEAVDPRNYLPPDPPLASN